MNFTDCRRCGSPLLIEVGRGYCSTHCAGRIAAPYRSTGPKVEPTEPTWLPVVKREPAVPAEYVPKKREVVDHSGSRGKRCGPALAALLEAHDISYPMYCNMVTAGFLPKRPRGKGSASTFPTPEQLAEAADAWAEHVREAKSKAGSMAWSKKRY